MNCNTYSEVKSSSSPVEVTYTRKWAAILLKVHTEYALLSRSKLVQYLWLLIVLIRNRQPVLGAVELNLRVPTNKSDTSRVKTNTLEFFWETDLRGQQSQVNGVKPSLVFPPTIKKPATYVCMYAWITVVMHAHDKSPCIYIIWRNVTEYSCDWKWLMVTYS